MDHSGSRESASRGRVAHAAALAASLVAVGCGAKEPGTGTCPEDHLLGTTCVGVASAPVCEEEVCTAGVSCSRTLDATDDASLATALSGATAGTCIAIHPGTYGDVDLPGGVSLLGRGAAFVTVKKVTLEAGAGAVVRGLAAASVTVVGATGARLDSLRVSHSDGSGLEIGPASSITVSACEIEASAQYGVHGADSASVSLKDSVVTGSSGPGVWVSCAAGCGCAQRPALALDAVILRDNKIVGLSLVGAGGTLSNVVVEGNQPTDDFKPGHGISVSACSTLDAKGVKVQKNLGFGVLVDDSSATLGDDAGDATIEVSGNASGVWIQNIAKSDPTALVKLTHATIEANQGIGLNFGGESHGIICWNSAIQGTTLTTVPVMKGGLLGSDKVGDGIVWADASSAQLDGITLADNQRESFLINGDVGAGSTVAHLTQSGTDGGKGIFQQSSSGVSPSLGEGAPMLTSSASEKFSVPVAPAAPASL